MKVLNKIVIILLFTLVTITAVSSSEYYAYRVSLLITVFAF